MTSSGQSAEGVKVLVVFHSITGNVMSLAKAVAQGAEEAGAKATIKRVEETIPEEVLERNPGYVNVRDELKSYPVATIDELPEYDAIVFGSPTRFGNMSSQMKTFIDQTGRHWVKGALSGKVGAVFTSNEMPHGGKEATLLSMILPLFAHGDDNSWTSSGKSSLQGGKLLRGDKHRKATRRRPGSGKTTRKKSSRNSRKTQKT